MTRADVNGFTATLRLDLALQRRNHLYLFTALTTVLLAVLLRAFVPGEALAEFLPGLFFLWLGSSTFMFCAAMLLFERGEGSLDALAVTPLPPRAYLLSKVVSLTLLGTAESLVILLFAYGSLPTLSAVNLFFLLPGLVGLAALYTLLGLVVVVRYRSVTHFVVTAPFVVAPLFIPALGLIGLWHPLFYLWPTQAPLLLLQGAFGGQGSWQILYAVLYTPLTLLAAFVWAEGAFDRHVIERRAA
ncbi:membrane protein [soil metagenome]|nr:ABC transporter permease [Deinococcota bacterium]